jgi:DNA-binding transcriptional LysR family regulator
VELRQLQYFAAVARHGHFTRAADELYVTQPALSQQIRRLEAELGLALLRRTSRGVELTPAGEDLLAHAEAVLAEVAAARADMDRHAGVSRGVARLAATAADAPRLPEALADFHQDHPGIQIALRQGSAAEVVALVQRGSVDVAVLALEGDPPPGVDVRPLAEEPLRVAVPVDDPLAGATVAIADLRGRPFILPEPGTALRTAVLDATQASGFSPLPLVEVGDPATVRHLVKAGLGVSLVPASWLERPGPIVAAADLQRAPRHRLSLLTPAAGPSPAGRLLGERLRAALSDPQP